MCQRHWNYISHNPTRSPFFLKPSLLCQVNTHLSKLLSNSSDITMTPSVISCQISSRATDDVTHQTVGRESPSKTPIIRILAGCFFTCADGARMRRRVSASSRKIFFIFHSYSSALLIRFAEGKLSCNGSIQTPFLNTFYFDKWSSLHTGQYVILDTVLTLVCSVRK